MTAAQPKGPIEIVEHIAWERHLSDDAALATLERMDACRPAFDVDRGRRERRDFGDAASTPAQHKTNGRVSGISAVRRRDETPSLGSVEIFSTAGRSVKAHPGVGMLAHCRLA